jgi:hypothetical protein
MFWETKEFGPACRKTTFASSSPLTPATESCLREQKKTPRGYVCFVGLYSLYGIESALWDSIIQIEGDAFRIDRQWLLGEMRRNDELREFLQRCHYIAISRLAQIAACNRLHSLRQRCCLWLLIAYDGARSDTFAVTHEFLAMMLGVQRVRLSIMAKSLQMSGIIQYTRGRITIVDRSALERAACECYRTIHTQFDQFFGPSDQFK